MSDNVLNLFVKEWLKKIMFCAKLDHYTILNATSILSRDMEYMIMGHEIYNNSIALSFFSNVIL